MFSRAFIFCLAATGLSLLFGCKKQTDDFSLLPASDYYPLQSGKVFIYRLDSTVTPAFGTSLDVFSSHVKDSVADGFSDNLGRPSYRIYRFITDTLQTKPWQYLSTYYITPTDAGIELMDDNNLRFLKLKAPLRNDFNWKGNSFIDTRSAGSPYQYLDGWDYVYQNANQPFTVLLGTLDSTITVRQRDETSPDAPFDPNNYQQRNYSIEVYAKGVGLIYKDFLHWTWQPTPPPAKYQDDSYGLKLNLIELR